LNTVNTSTGFDRSSGKIPTAAANTLQDADARGSEMGAGAAYLPWLLLPAAGKMALRMVLRQNTLQ
jgi:hypothetical protein